MTANVSELALLEKPPLAVLEQTPSQFPPPGQISNFVDPPNLTITVAVVLAVTSFLMFVAVVLRVCSKITSSRPFTWDDYTRFLAMVGSLAYSAVIFRGTFSYVGIHLWNVPLSVLFSSSYFQEIVFISSAHAPIVLMAKLSLFILYLRLFGRIKSTRILVWIGIVSCILFNTFGCVFVLALSGPHHRYETRIVVTRTRTIVGFSTTSFNILSDIYLVAVPIPAVMKLQMSIEKKIRVCFVFMLGILGCICGVISMYYWVVWERSSDKTYRLAAALLASIVEFNVGIVVEYMPVIQPALLSRFAEVYRLCSFRCLASCFSRPGRTPMSCEQHQPEGRSYLETRILSGVNGEGKFMSSVEAPVRIQLSMPSPSRSPFSTQTSWRNNNINNTAIGTQLSDQSMMMKTSVSSDSHSDTNQDGDPSSHYMLQVERIRNMV